MANDVEHFSRAYFPSMYPLLVKCLFVSFANFPIGLLDPCLVLSLRRKMFSLSPLSVMLAIGFFGDALYQVRKFPSIHSFMKVFFFLILYWNDYAKAFDCVDHHKLWKILKRWEY